MPRRKLRWIPKEETNQDCWEDEVSSTISSDCFIYHGLKPFQCSDSFFYREGVKDMSSAEIVTSYGFIYSTTTFTFRLFVSPWKSLLEIVNQVFSLSPSLRLKVYVNGEVCVLTQVLWTHNSSGTMGLKKCMMYHHCISTSSPTPPPKQGNDNVGILGLFFGLLPYHSM